MVNNLYAIYNILSKRYNNVSEYPTDEYAKQRILETGKAHPEYIRLDESELYRIGCMDVETGVVTPLSEPVLIKIEESEYKTPIEAIEKDLTNAKAQH